MKAVICDELGGVDSLKIVDLEESSPGPDEVLVSVKAVGLNFFDTLITQGKYQVRPELPFSPGAEFAGVIKQVGENVSSFKTGDRVMAWLGYGAAREQVLVEAAKLIRIPDNVSYETAAGSIVTYGTSLYGLKDRAKLQTGETVAVLGASGGVGIAAVEIAKAMDAHVIACASSDEKLEFCRQHGADEVLNYSDVDLKQALKDKTSGKGVDVVYDPIGGEFSEKAVRALGWCGRLLVIGFATGDIPKIPLNLLLLKNCDLVGVFWGESLNKEPTAHTENTALLMQWIAEKKINPFIDQTFPLDQTQHALGLIQRREVKGKVVVTC